MAKKNSVLAFQPLHSGTLARTQKLTQILTTTEFSNEEFCTLRFTPLHHTIYSLQLGISPRMRNVVVKETVIVLV